MTVRINSDDTKTELEDESLLQRNHGDIPFYIPPLKEIQSMLPHHYVIEQGIHTRNLLS